MNWPTSAGRFASVSLLSFTLLFAAAGCEDANDLGVELPGTSNAATNYRDFPVTASTILRDSAETLKANNFLVGRVQDNVLGTTTANAFLNLKVSPAVGDTLPANVAGAATANAQLDSLVLVLPFDNVFGSATAPLRANVYQLAQPLDERVVYNSTSSVPAGAELGRDFVARLNANKRQRQRTNSTSTTDTATVVVTVPDPTVRFKLHGGGRTLPLATELFDRLKNSSFNQARLDEVWKGLYIEPTTDFNTAVVGLAASAGTRAVFYYRYTNKKNNGTLKGRYSIAFGTGPTPDAGRYFTQLSTALPAGPLSRLVDARQLVPAAETNNLVYMQAGTGFGARLEIPGLQVLKTQAQGQTAGGPAIAINRAELLVPVKPFSNLLFAVPSTAYLYEVNANNQALQRTLLNSRVERIVLRDGVSQQGLGLSGIGDDQQGGGYYQNAAAATLFPLTDVNSYYSMVLTGYVQSYVYDKLSGAAPAAFVLSPTLRNSRALGLNRAVLDGTGVKLRVYYSELR